MMTNQEIIDVVTAFENGVAIESRRLARCGGTTWVSSPHPNWNFYHCEFRVVRKPIERWANVYTDGSSIFYPTEEAARRVAIEPMARIAVHLVEAAHDA
jgi:hypothetical protein